MSSLHRTTFETNRESEFFTKRELQMQIGAPEAEWPLALVKELLDNALDACEAAGRPPQLRVTVEEDGNGVEVADNGPGLPPTVLRRSLDYQTRISDKLYYVSPTRGQQGNALKCIWAASLVASDQDVGRTEVCTGGTAYRIRVRHNEIRGVPDIRLTEAASDVKTGTVVRMQWPGVARYLTPSTCAFLRSGGRPGAWTGERVELNAMTSRQLVDLVEQKLEAYGVEKVIPDRETLRDTWNEMHRLREAERMLREIRESSPPEDAPPLPANIREHLRDRLDGTPAAWDDALWTLTKPE